MSPDQTPRDLLGRPVRIPRTVRQGELAIPYTAEELAEMAERARLEKQPKTLDRDPFTLDMFNDDGGR